MITQAEGDFRLDDEAATGRLGAAIAAELKPGEAICLTGPLGPGKSTLAPALVRAMTTATEDVPSPTFTLVQFYESDPPVAHFDLYRLTRPEEAFEIGLDEALDEGAALIEWPERLGDAAPQDAIRLRLSAAGEGRQALIALPGHPELAAALAAEWAADA